MSSVLYNKLKTIETSRSKLEEILTEKGVNIANNSLDSLVGSVSRLQLPDYTQQEEVWEGLPIPEEPTAYYKGDDDWVDLIDIQKIISEDTASSTYTGKVFFLIRVSSNFASDFNSNCLKGFNAYKFSDTKTLTTSIAHTWDSSKDIVADNGERFRWVIAYTSSTTAQVYWQSYYFVPEAVIYYSGSYNCICFQDSPNSYNNGPSINSSTGRSNSRGAKFIEVKPSVSTKTIMGTSNESYRDENIRTVIVDGSCTSDFYGLVAPNLEFFRWSKNGCTGRFNGLGYINHKGRSYISINAIINCSITYMNFINNADIYIKQCKSISEFKNNKNCNIKIDNVNGDIAGECFLNSILCNIHIEDGINTIGGSAFDGLLDSNIKIGIIYGNIGSFAFRNCAKFNQDIKLISKSSTNYTLGSSIFYNTGVSYIDLSESRITMFTTADATSNSTAYDPYTSTNYAR